MERLRQQVPTRLGLASEAAPTTPPPHLTCRPSPWSSPPPAKPRRQPRPLNQRHCTVSHLSALLRSADPRSAPLLTVRTPPDAASPPESYTFDPPASPQDKRQYAWDAHSASALPRRLPAASTRRALNTNLLECALSNLRLVDTHHTPVVHPSKSSKVQLDATRSQQVGRAAFQPFAFQAAGLQAVRHAEVTCDQAPRSQLAHEHICADGNGGYSADGRGTDDDDNDEDDDDDDYRRPAHNGEGNDWEPNGGEGDPADGGDGDGTESSNTNKRRGQPASSGPLSCPYRKRNKQRFNVRDYPKCTKEYRDLSSLKTHVRSDHARKVDCIRCWQQFPSPAALDDHTRRLSTGGQICDLVDPPPRNDEPEDVEDGVTQTIADRLIARTDSHKVCTWTELWRILFPRDIMVPSSVHESCTQAETAELQPVALKAFERAMCCLPGLMAAELGNYGHGPRGVDPTRLASRIQEVMRPAFAGKLADCLKEFEHRIKRHPAPLNSLENRAIRARRQRGRANHSSDTQAPSSGTSFDDGDQRAQRQRTLLPAARPSVADNSVFSPIADSSPVPALQHQAQHQRHPSDAFPSSAGPGSLAWPAPNGQSAGSAIIPMFYQQTGGLAGMTPAGAAWPSGISLGQGLPHIVDQSRSYAGGLLYPGVFPTQQRPSSSPPLMYPLTTRLRRRSALTLARHFPTGRTWPDWKASDHNESQDS